jgi:hypothetical protein
MGENYKPKRKRGEIMKSEVIGLRLESDILDEIREQARKNSRSIAKEITHQLKQKKEREAESVESLETFAEYCREYIINNISDNVGQDFPSSYDLAYMITESDNASGSFTYSTYKARQYLGAWFENVGVFMEQYKEEYGEYPEHNPFANVELFHGLMVIHGIQNILTQIKALNKDEPQRLTEQLAEHIKQETEKFFPLFDYVENNEGK